MELLQALTVFAHAMADENRMPDALLHTEPQAMLLPDRTSSSIAHEVNNILTPAALLLESVLCDESIHSDARASIEHALRCIDESREVSQLLLDLTRPDQDLKVRLAIRDVFNNLRLAFRVHPEAAAIELFTHAPNDCSALGNRHALLRVLLNLVSNAASVGGPGTTITVAASTIQSCAQRFHAEHPLSSDVVRITITDTGPGIKAEDLPSLFDPSFSQRRGGTGLGLYICSQLVDSMSGHIDAESTPGLGTTFTIDLPAANKAQPSE